MTITWRHMGVTLFIALALHGGIAMWLALPAPQPLPEPPAPPLRVSLLATVAETTTTPAVTPPPQPVAKPPPPEKTEPVPEPEPEPVTEKPIPEPKPVMEPTPPSEPQPPPEPVVEAAPVPVEPTPAPLSAAATVKYEQLLVAWLEKHKKYPRRAKRLRIEGKGMLRILIDRNGRTQKITLEQRTGNRLLDKAALAMAQRADPFPPMPENDPRRELEFMVPVVFALR